MTPLGRLTLPSLLVSALLPWGNAVAQGAAEIITCGEAGLISTYCYTANDSQSWLYEASGAGTMRLRFNRGTIESNTWDDIRIYDGADNTGTLLFEHDNAAQYNLGPVGSAVVNTGTMFYGIEVFASGANLFMEMSSDGSVQCQGSTTYDSWEWEVVCLDCTLPVVDYTIVDDCEAAQFTIPIEITSTGDGSFVNIVYIVNGGDPQTVINVGTGTADLGPFALNDTVNVVVEHENNFLCNVDFGDLTDTGMCPELIECGTELSDSYCYVNNADRRYYYRGLGTFPLGVFFSAGRVFGGDSLIIYDGADITAPRLFAGTNQFVTDLFRSTTNPEHRLTIQVKSNAFTSCVDGFEPEELAWTVACLDCVPATVDFSIVQDCENFQYFVDVNITDLGTDPEAQITNTETQDIILVTEVGVTQIGPFVSATELEVTVVNDANSLCNVRSGLLVNSLCPTPVECGTDLVQTFCHGENEDQMYLFQGNGTFPIAMVFNAGSLEPCCDRLFVYDGEDMNAPPLTPAIGVNGELTGQLFISTNPDHFLFVRITTDGSVSCESGSYDELDWTVSCLDCQPPTVDFAIVQDCENFQFFIDVDVTELGTDTEAQLVTTATQDTILITEAGVIQLGPFVSGTELEVSILNDANSLCDVRSGILVNPLCPVLIDCPSDALVETYCYVANDSRAWAYELTSPGTLRLTFVRGTIEAGVLDELVIYDGPDNTSPVLFIHGTGTGTANLGPEGSAILSTAIYETVDVAATGLNLYMEMSSDGSVQCNTTTYDEWEWEVYCLNCTTPQATVNIVPDCLHREYSTEVIVTEVGGDAQLTIENTFNGSSMTDLGVGVYTFGPYTVDSLSQFVVFNQDYVQCRNLSDTLTFAGDSCIAVTCGVDDFEYCYENSEDRWYSYQADANAPITLRFTQGQLLTGDRISVFNGRNSASPLLYNGNNGGNLTGFQVNSANVDNILTLRIVSDSVGSCDDGQATASLQWLVGCGAVGIDERGVDGFSIFPNPTEGLLTIEMDSEVSGSVQLSIADMSGRVVLEKQLLMGGGTRQVVDLSNLQSGQYLIQLMTTDRIRTERVQLTR